MVLTGEILMARKPLRRQKTIGFQQVLLQDSSVNSTQWMTLPSTYCETLDPSQLLERYLRHIRLFTLTLIRPSYVSAHELEFRLLNTRYSLISFTGPHFATTEGVHMVSLSICGGLLVQRDNCRRGGLSFITKKIRNGLKVIVQLSDYCPLLLGSARPARWRKVLYRLTQAYIHRIVTIRFLSRLYRDLEGNTATVRVVRRRTRHGEDI